MRYLRVGSVVALLIVAAFMSGTSMAAQEFTTADVKAKIEEIIAAKVKEGGGVFKFRDEKTGEEVPLEFVTLRFIRGIKGHGYFGSVDFRVQGEPNKLYDIDFWVKPKDDQLVLVDIKTHRYPKREGNDWVQVRTDPLPWWWAVAQEHPGETEEKKGWEIKAAMHEHIVQKVEDGGGAFKYKDEKTGEALALEFVKIHDPVTKTKQGYFACTDFRVKGEPAKLYDLDFWVNEKDGKLVVTDTRIHKEPQKEGGEWIKKPRYGFDKDGNPVEIK
ncbi:MAG TPA: hypothetical protein VJM10_02790 [Candidatus Methylomirabilis sp.]|nr:hypothetical protein [Candidatus Methylomirabilis sp.]